jgi:ATP-dependent Clp protease ATP-binding subunit ClpC
MQDVMNPAFGFGSEVDPNIAKSFGRLGGRAMQKVFDPEFINRIDSSVVFDVLTEEDIQEILELELEKFRNHIISRLRERAFLVTVDDSAKAFITQRGFNQKYGARELKRVIQKYILQPVAVGINNGDIIPGKIEVLRVSHEKGDQLKLSPITYHVGNATKKPQNSAGKERLPKPSTADSA